MVFFLCAVYNQIQHKLQMSSNDRDYTQQRVGETTVAANARVNAAAASPDSIIAENAIRRQKIHQQIDAAIVCPDCKRTAHLFEDPNYKCKKCKNSQGGYKRKYKSQRRKKSKSQRRKKSIKRRH